MIPFISGCVKINVLIYQRKKNERKVEGTMIIFNQPIEFTKEQILLLL